MEGLDQVADALYAADPDDFVEARTAAVATARAAGDRELAKRLGALKRPTRSAWLVNLLVRADPGATDRLAAIAADLGQAHATGEVSRLALPHVKLIAKADRVPHVL